MPNFRENRLAILEAYSDGNLNEEEFILSFDINRSTNLDLPYWNYEKFDLENMSNDECKAEFRFLKNDIYTLHDVMRFPEEIVCSNGFKVPGLYALCVLLKRFAYPCRYLDIMPRFGLSIPQLSMISNKAMNIIYDDWGHLLRSFEQEWLSPENLSNYANIVHQRGAPLPNCWGFVDGTVRRICRPGVNQRVMYNGHKKIHAIKFQSVVAPNGMVANMFGPVEGKRHDATMLVRSELLTLLQVHSRAPDDTLLCIYGDPAYPLRPQLMAPFRGANLDDRQQIWNTRMNAVRTAVEWVFNDIVNYYKFLDFHKNLKIQLSAVGKMYLVCALLQNARSCFYGSLTADFFDCQPPSIQSYFQN